MVYFTKVQKLSQRKEFVSRMRKSANCRLAWSLMCWCSEGVSSKAALMSAHCALESKPEKENKFQAASQPICCRRRNCIFTGSNGADTVAV